MIKIEMDLRENRIKKLHNKYYHVLFIKYSLFRKGTLTCTANYSHYLKILCTNRRSRKLIVSLFN